MTAAAVCRQRLLVERRRDRLAHQGVVRQLGTAVADAESLTAADDDDVVRADRDVNVTIHLEHQLLGRRHATQVDEFLAALGARGSCQLLASDIDMNSVQRNLRIQVRIQSGRNSLRPVYGLYLDGLTPERRSLTLLVAKPDELLVNESTQGVLPSR
jgi:hypothetical protein